ncbi:ABC transporter substrate-binding protein (plasmid) [Rhizobium sp. RCAM05350]|nr:ABC transporter substrate-binding protein [Rhizobium sp. RCAM05350]
MSGVISSITISRRVLIRSGLAVGTVAAAAGPLALRSVFAQTDTPQSGGTLRVAVPGGSADSLDPHRTQAQVSDMVRFMNLFDGLSEYTSDGTVRLSLAETMTPNETATEWTVKLHQGIKTHGGADFQADDVIFSVRRILDGSAPTKGAALIKFVDPAKVEKIDDLTLKFTLDNPHGLFPDVWANLFLRMVPRDFDAANPDGTGPFRYESFTPGQESTFKSFGSYFREKAWIDTLVVVVINDNTAAINALRGGQIDVSYTMPFSEARTVEASPDLRLLNNPTPMEIPIYMRTDVAPFDDVRVRQAMRLVANRKQLVSVALAGYGTIGNDMVGRSMAPCVESSLPQREQSIEEAKKLLAEADQSDLSVEMVTVNGTAGMVECAQVFAEQAKAVGVTINVKNMEVGAYLANYGNWTFRGRLLVGFLSRCCGIQPPAEWYFQHNSLE